MRYHYEKPTMYRNMYGETYECDHPVCNKCTLFKMGKKRLAVIQQRYEPRTKHTHWGEIDPWLTDELYLHPKFKPFFDERAGFPEEGLYPTVMIRQMMWGMKMKPIPTRTMGDLLRSEGYLVL